MRSVPDKAIFRARPLLRRASLALVAMVSLLAAAVVSFPAGARDDTTSAEARPPARGNGDDHGAFVKAPPFDSDDWSIDAREYSIEEHLGRKALVLKGGIAWLPAVSLTDGVLEFDIAFSGERGFMGGIWRLQDRSNYEELYIRPHQSGKSDANQYTPIFNGAAGWQLYHGGGFGAPVSYEPDTWTPVRIVFAGGRGEVYIGDLESPTIVIGEMLRAPLPGPVGLMAGNFAPAAFSRVRYREGAPPLRGTPALREPAAAGTIMSWQVSPAFAEGEIASLTELPEETPGNPSWTELSADRAGIANLARVQGVRDESNTVFARVPLHAERALPVRLDFGYSDRVRVFLNGRLVYSGDNTYRSRDFRYLGTIGLFDQVVLPLEPGKNDLRLAVSESFGGWGVLARLQPADGVRVGGGQVGP